MVFLNLKYFVILSIFLFYKNSEATKLQNCSISTSAPQLCITGDSYVVPVSVLDKLPLHVNVYVGLYDIIEVDPNKHSVTVHLDLALTWNDTAVGLAKPE